MEQVTAAAQLIVFSRYIGQQVVISNRLNHGQDAIGDFIGIKENAILVAIDGTNRWVPVSDDVKLCGVKLLLKPLKRLTAAIIDTANNLPVQAFITPYYQSLGFDMPVYIAPGHALNCRYVHELGLADYREAEDILLMNEELVAVHG